MSKGGGGGAVAPPGLSDEEKVLIQEQVSLLRQSSRIIDEKKWLMQDLLANIGPQLGLEPVFEGGGTPGEGLSFAGGVGADDIFGSRGGDRGLPEDEPSFLRGEIERLEALPATISRQVGQQIFAHGTPIPRRTVQEDNPARAELASLRTRLVQAEARPKETPGRRLIGFRRVERPEEARFEEPAAQLEEAFAAKAQEAVATGPTEIETATREQALSSISRPTRLEDLAKKQAELGLAGELDAEELNPFLARQLQKARDRQRDLFQRQGGTGFETSTPFAEASRQFEEGAAAQLAQAARDNIFQLAGLGQSEEAARRAGIGQNVGISQAERGIRNQETGFFAGLTGQQSAARLQRDAGLLTQKAAAAELPFGGSANALSQLASGFGQAAQPFAQQRQDAFAAALQNQQVRSQESTAFGSGIGTLLGVGLKVGLSSLFPPAAAIPPLVVG